MKYGNASSILPKELLREVQKYAAGKLLYIPSREEKRAWSETFGYREQLQKRNRMIWIPMGSRFWSLRTNTSYLWMIENYLYKKITVRI